MAERHGWSLARWLAWQQQDHPRSIDLGLARVAAVAEALQLLQPPAKILSVAGTNGKGTCALSAEALARAAGLRVGCYTSPHLWRYAERIRVDGRAVADADICAAFRAIDQARGGQSLSYFEWGTLAAAWLFQRAECDLWVLEVGLGGRLDAVNVWSADVAVVTAIGLDHQAWLGPDRASIAREKAGIARAGRPLIIGERHWPIPLGDAAMKGAQIEVIGRDFDCETRVDGARYQGHAGQLCWPPPAGCVASNQACALQALSRLNAVPQSPASVLPDVRLPGRCQRQRIGAQHYLFDVAHNLEAIDHLCGELARPPALPRAAVFAALADKPLGAMTAALAPHVDVWLLPQLDDARAAMPEAVLACLPTGAAATIHARCDSALAAAQQWAGGAGEILVCGSFVTVAEIGTLLHG